MAWPRSPRCSRRRRRRAPTSEKSEEKKAPIDGGIAQHWGAAKSSCGSISRRARLRLRARRGVMSFKTVGIVLGTLVAALLIGAGLFVAFFPKELAAHEAERRIEEATGRELSLGDEISVSFWPALGFSVNQASLSNPEGFAADQPFIAADRIVFAVKVMPLLRGAVEVKELIFEGAEVRMQARRDGETNWTFPTRDTEEDQFTLEDLRLDDVRMIDGMISFQGAEGGPPLVLEDVDASLTLTSLDAPATLDAAFNYRGERLDVDGTLGVPRAVLEKGE